jgi:hypothetical protein
VCTGLFVLRQRFFLGCPSLGVRCKASLVQSETRANKPVCLVGDAIGASTLRTRRVATDVVLCEPCS